MRDDVKRELESANWDFLMKNDGVHTVRKSEKDCLYDELCSVLDTYEASKEDDSMPLYEMLCEIQSCWENITK